ncbi:MAG: class I SAM-dependent methyltransferase [Oscillospiraceae bacterium]|nr:class I SAM-dependent methyltransferase [Oscillospiraceae bacterium]
MSDIRISDLISAWHAEESIAHIHGWDFSHINNRYTEETDFPWDYRELILGRLKPEMKLLDIDTGGGEFLLSLGHPHRNCAATENYPPNIELCRETLSPLGIDFRPADGNGPLPFADGSFDMVIDRHGDFNPREIHRVLKQGGLFITQQVGADNDRALVELLLDPVPPLPFPEQYLSIAEEKFRTAGFEILEQAECFRPIKFYDVGALVWFARIIEWEFPGFSVDTCLLRLLNAQHLLEERGSLDAVVHRFMLVAQKL